MRKPTAERGLGVGVHHAFVDRQQRSCPASGSRMMPEKKPEAALFGLPGRTTIEGSLMPTPSMKPSACSRSHRLAHHLCVP